MKMYHTSIEILKEGSINSKGIAGECLFFSSAVYNPNPNLKDFYVYEAEFETIEACFLDNDEIIADIADYCEVDASVAEDLLKNRIQIYDIETDLDLADTDWWLQGKRGECAKLMGYDGAEDFDEQGVVYIIPMIGRESELTLLDQKGY